MTTRVVLFMEGGLVQSAVADAEVRLLIVDSDLEGLSEEEITHIPALEDTVDHNAGDVYLSGTVVEQAPNLVDEIFEVDRKRFEEEKA